MLLWLFFSVFSSEDVVVAERRGRMAKRRSKGTRERHSRGKPDSCYFTQPGKRGSVVVLRKPCGNRISPKVCGTMPTRVHAKMLISQLQKAESVVNDLFLEATDDGIEALEAVLAACCDEVLRRGPGGGRRAERGQEEASDNGAGPAEGSERQDGIESRDIESRHSEDSAAD